MSIIIIAEAGVNHNGNMEIAREMIHKAKEAGADYIKFQSFKASDLVSKNAEKARYQKKNTSDVESQLEMLRKLEIGEEELVELQKLCAEIDIGFMSSPFGVEQIYLLDRMNVDYIKIPSGEITNFPYLKTVSQIGRDVILSTGMSELSEIEEAIKVLRSINDIDIVILQCNTQYPTPFSDVNLNVMSTLKEHFDLAVGYSDHTEGIEIAIAAAALGAVVIEKHFTLDKTMIGPDHLASLGVDELTRMITAIRNVEKALGSYDKYPSKSEMENRDIARKSITAARNITKGEKFTENNLCIKRPGTGISPMMWEQVIGEVALRDYIEDELIEI